MKKGIIHQSDKIIISNSIDEVNRFVGKKSIRGTYAVIEFNRDCVILMIKRLCNSLTSLRNHLMYTLIIISQFVSNVHTFVESSAKKQTSDRDQLLCEMKNHHIKSQH